MRVTRSVSGPDGFNLGINQGPVAGAGIAAHLHQHVVPRWSGDANFLPVIAQTKAAAPAARPDLGAAARRLVGRLMLERFRAGASRLIAPLALFLNRLGVSPDLVTAVGTLGVMLGALICYPLGFLWQGTVIVTFFVLADMLDGQMAKLSGTASTWGAFLDSSLDRLGDGAVFGGLLLYFAYQQQEPVWAGFTLAALVLGQLTSYVRARAESLGFEANGGIAARADRLLIILAGALLAGFGVPYVLEIAVVFLAVAGLITVGQRGRSVYRQAKAPGVEPA